MEKVLVTKKIIGIDSNKKLFSKIQERFSKFKNVGIFLENAKKMHFPDDIFDYTICMGNTFGDFGRDKLKILKEMKRVTKKDGKIVISVYSENSLNTRIEEYKKVGVKIKKIRDGTVYAEDGLVMEQFTKERLNNIFKSTGLKAKIIKLNPISYLCEAVVGVV